MVIDHHDSDFTAFRLLEGIGLYGSQHSGQLLRSRLGYYTNLLDDFIFDISRGSDPLSRVPFSFYCTEYCTDCAVDDWQTTPSSCPVHTGTTRRSHRLLPIRSSPAPPSSMDLGGRSSAGEKRYWKAYTGLGIPLEQA